MKASEFRDTRERLGLSVAELGAILDVRADTIRRWETGRSPMGPSPMAARTLAWMRDGFRPPQWPDRLRGSGIPGAMDLIA